MELAEGRRGGGAGEEGVATFRNATGQGLSSDVGSRPRSTLPRYDAMLSAENACPRPRPRPRPPTRPRPPPPPSYASIPCLACSLAKPVSCVRRR